MWTKCLSGSFGLLERYGLFCLMGNDDDDDV
jgi:hypothetical protein